MRRWEKREETLGIIIKEEERNGKARQEKKENRSNDKKRKRNRNRKEQSKVLLEPSRPCISMHMHIHIPLGWLPAVRYDYVLEYGDASYFIHKRHAKQEHNLTYRICLICIW